MALYLKLSSMASHAISRVLQSKESKPKDQIDSVMDGDWLIKRDDVFIEQTTVIDFETEIKNVFSNGRSHSMICKSVAVNDYLQHNYIVFLSLHLSTCTWVPLPKRDFFQNDRLS